MSLGGSKGPKPLSSELANLLWVPAVNGPSRFIVMHMVSLPRRIGLVEPGYGLDRNKRYARFDHIKYHGGLDIRVPGSLDLVNAASGSGESV